MAILPRLLKGQNSGHPVSSVSGHSYYFYKRDYIQKEDVCTAYSIEEREKETGSEDRLGKQEKAESVWERIEEWRRWYREAFEQRKGECSRL